MKFQCKHTGIRIAAIAALMFAGLGAAGAAPGEHQLRADAPRRAQTIPNTAPSNHTAQGILLAQQNSGGFRSNSGMRRGGATRAAPRAQAPRFGIGRVGPGARAGIRPGVRPGFRQGVRPGIRPSARFAPRGVWRWQSGRPIIGSHWGYRNRRAGYRYYNGWWFPAAAFATGAIIGGAVLGAPAYAGGNEHIAWCEDRYRSYRASDNTFQPYNGPRQECVSPYNQ